MYQLNRALAAAATTAVALIAWATSPVAASAPHETVLQSRLSMQHQQTSSLVQAGPVASRQLGAGRMRATSIAERRRTYYRTTTTLRLTHGTLKLTGTNHVVPTPDGNTLIVRGSAKVVSGTGSFRGASGQFTVRGRGPVSLKWMVLTLTGTLDA